MSPEEATSDEISAAFGRLLDRHCPRGGAAEAIGQENGQLWPALAAGGWLAVGAAQQDGGSGLGMAELSLLAFEWGRRLPPLPFSTSALGRRWGRGQAADPGQQFTFALPAPVGTVIPFGRLAAVQPDVAIDEQQCPAVWDSFAPALPLLRAGGRSLLSAVQLSEVQLMFAAESVGAAQQTFDRACAYAQERIAYGSPISGFQVMRHWLADMHCDLELAKTALFWALNVAGEERQRALRNCADLSQRVATAAIQVFGGIGFTWDFGAHLHLRHTMVVSEIAHLRCPAA
jgi:alkylation response protein AidB-like acyl-CoA dehydrogenase